VRKKGNRSSGGAVGRISVGAIGLVLLLETVPAAGQVHRKPVRNHGKSAANFRKQGAEVIPLRMKAAGLLRDLRSLRNLELFDAYRKDIRAVKLPRLDPMDDKEVARISARLGEKPTLLPYLPPKQPLNLLFRVFQAVDSLSGMGPDSESNSILAAQLQNRLRRMEPAVGLAEGVLEKLQARRRGLTPEQAQRNIAADLHQLNRQLGAAGLRHGTLGLLETWQETDAATARMRANLPRVKRYIENYRLRQTLEGCQQELDDMKTPVTPERAGAIYGLMGQRPPGAPRWAEVALLQHRGSAKLQAQMRAYHDDLRAALHARIGELTKALGPQAGTPTRHQPKASSLDSSRR